MARRLRHAALIWDRILTAVAAAVVGILATTFSVAQVASRSNPAFALQIAPYDGSIRAAQAITLQTEGGLTRSKAAERLAARALQQDPTAIGAVTVLGLQVGLRQDLARSERLLAYAQMLSRRDVRTQMWSIENAVAAGNIPAALRWYDIALRTKPATADTLFAVLAGATAEPAVRTELVRTLAARPRWGNEFALYLAARASDPAVPAKLFVGLRMAHIPVPERARADTINRLLAQGRVEAAWAFYSLNRPSLSRLRSRDPAFAAKLQSPSSLDWVPINDNGVTTSIQDGAAEFSAPTTVGGALLQQTQLLAPGLYRLTGRSADIDQPEDARPYWTLNCLDGRELGRIALANSPQGSTPFTGTFQVPGRSCPIQILKLIGRPSERVEGFYGRIKRADLQPAGSTR
jgi:hypothetical protein